MLKAALSNPFNEYIPLTLDIFSRPGLFFITGGAGSSFNIEGSNYIGSGYTRPRNSTVLQSMSQTSEALSATTPFAVNSNPQIKPFS